MRFPWSRSAADRLEQVDVTGREFASLLAAYAHENGRVCLRSGLARTLRADHPALFCVASR